LYPVARLQWTALLVDDHHALRLSVLEMTKTVGFEELDVVLDIGRSHEPDANQFAIRTEGGIRHGPLEALPIVAERRKQRGVIDHDGNRLDQDRHSRH